jgi:hypothetical protein
MENKLNLKNISWDKLAFIVGIPLAIIGIIVAIWPENARVIVITVISSVWTWIISGIIFLFGVGWYVKKFFYSSFQHAINESNKTIGELNRTIGELNKAIEESNKTIDELKQLPERKKPSIPRWEYFSGNKVRFGSLKYPPMLEFDFNDKPIGIGIHILTKIFEGKLERERKKVTWDNLNKALYEKDDNGNFKIDIIATPIFETHERSNDLAFSLPIFYSEIGLYYNSEDSRFKHLAPQPFEEAKKIINYQKNETLFFYCIEGELSQRLAKKYFNEKQLRLADPRQYSIQSLLETVIDDKEKSDIVFAETYQAEQLIKMKRSEGDLRFNNLKNMLKPKQLLYPVVFALRKEDYVLKNYINLKLIEIDGPGFGINNLIKESLSNVNNDFSHLEENSKEKFISEFFIRQYHHLA